MSLYGLQYRTYNASNNTWSNWSTFSSGSTNNTCYVTGVGSKIQFKRENNAPLAIGYDAYSYFKNLTGNCYVYGNVMSLYNFETVLNDTYACFKLFDNNAGISNHPTKDLVLGATTLSNSCYMYMFRNCTGLTRIPELPVTTLTNYCYYEMFRGCTALNTTPVLPATTLANYCYYGMFRECSSLTTPPELPVTTLANNCYCCMFCDCTNLQSAPVLPATIMAESCYGAMFAGCTSLQTAPELPATTLASDCYNEMFNRCTGLTIAPELPATVMVHKCYYDMFGYCTNLQTAPALPSTSMAYWCYNKMFEYCTSLTTAPVLPATTLAQGCYIWMFFGCSNLNYVKCLATDISADNCTLNWLTNVSPTGTFVKAAGMEDWEIGVNPDDGEYYGIPEGWLVESIDVFTTDGDWDVAANWSGNAVPADGSDVAIVANAIVPSNYTANADNIDIYGSLTIADGGQLIHSNAINATLQKEIVGFGNDNTVKTGWYTIASPVTGDHSTEGLTIGSYDLYLYNEPTHYWWNAKGDPQNPHNFDVLTNGQGYLYANSSDKTLSFIGEMLATNTSIITPLSFASNDRSLKGFNLVGNPFTCNITGNITIGGSDLTSYYIADGTADGGQNLIACNINDRAIKPGEGFMVQATDEEQSLIFNASRGRGEQTGYISIVAGNGNFKDRAYVQIGCGNTLRKMSLNDNTTKIYVVKEGKDYAAATIEATEGEMPLNFKATENGSYTITVNPKNIELAYLHLIDNMTGTDVDLLATPDYTFEAKATDYESRFRLVFASTGSETDNTGSETFAFISNGNWIINNDGDAILQVVDINGRIISSESISGCVNKHIEAAPGIYMLRLVSGTDTKVQKIVVR